MSVTQSSVVELRQYTLKPGATQTLLDVFEAELVESQEALGMAVGGLFHDRDDADRFVWLRGFDSMESRREALAAFYGGPVWKRHGPAANATMVDSDDVLLLRPTVPPHRALEPGPRAAVGTATTGDEWVVVTAWLHAPATAPARGWPRPSSRCWPRLSGPRSPPGAPSRPRTPSPPSRSAPTTPSSGPPRFADHAAYVAAITALERHPAWPRTMSDLDARDVLAETLRLRPTARSSHPPAG